MLKQVITHSRIYYGYDRQATPKLILLKLNKMCLLLLMVAEI